MAGDKAKRLAMNLSELDEDNDKFIKNNKDFTTKTNLQDACLKTTFVDKTEKPEGPILCMGHFKAYNIFYKPKSKMSYASNRGADQSNHP